MNLRQAGTLRRIRLGRAALLYAGHDWDVTPGACYAGSRFACGRPGCPTMTCHPALERWAEAASHDPRTVAAWWRHAPYSVLFATGRAFDVLEVPAYLGAPVVGRDIRGPVAVSPTGRWMFLVRPGEPLRPELDERLDVVRHGRDSWVPAPPTRLLEGSVRWAVSPEEVAWRLPEPYPVQAALIDVIDSAAGPRFSRIEIRPAA
jgi:Bifunctional DNA primase/polymerase, N-terminal